MKADIIIKGTIYDGLELKPEGTIAAVKDGVYCFVGSEEKLTELQDENTLIVQAEGGMLLPDLFEGHAHVCSGIDLFRGVNLYGMNSPEQYLNAIGAFIKEHPEREYITGRGFLNGDFGAVGPTANLLDEVTCDKYIILDSEDCHSSWVNSKVLQAAEINEHTRDLQNGVIVRYTNSKKPTGWLKEKEMDRVRKLLPRYRVEDYKEAILKYQEIAISYGIGCTYEPVMNDKKDIAFRLQAYHELDAENKLIMQFRAGITMDPGENINVIVQQVTDYRKKYNSSHFELMGIKVFIDGVIEGHTAYLREPYADQPEDCGYNMWSQEKLNSLFIKAAELDIPIHVHAIGDGAIASALDAFEEAVRRIGRKDIRNCITHLQVVGEDQFMRFRELGIIAVTNPFWHFKNPAYFDVLEVPFLGKERAEREYPMKSFFENGVVVTQASDWPVTYSFSPLIGLEIAVTRREAGNTQMTPLNEAEKVTTNQMLRVLTVNGAYQTGTEQQLGSIEVGKRASFIIVDRNILSTPGPQLSKTAILRHFIDGKEVYHKEVS